MAWDHSKTRQERGYGKEWTKLRKQVLRRDAYLCQICLAQGRLTPLGEYPYDHAVDHITPKARGGTDYLSNLQSLCTKCHKVKSDTDRGNHKPKLQRLDGWNP